MEPIMTWSAQDWLAVPPISSFFVGREKEIEEIERQILYNSSGVVAVVAEGVWAKLLSQ